MTPPSLSSLHSKHLHLIFFSSFSLILQCLAPPPFRILVAFLVLVLLPFNRRTSSTTSSMDSSNGIGSSGVKHGRSEDNNPRPHKIVRTINQHITSKHHPVSFTLASNYYKYLKTGVPSRIQIYEGNRWMDLPDCITETFVGGFKDGKSSVNFDLNGEQFLWMDFMSMVLINTRTGKVQSLSWVDEAGKNFSPDVTVCQLGTPPNELDAWILSCGGQPHGVSYPQPQASSESPLVCQPLFYPIVSRLQRNSPRFLAICEMFLSGMGPFATVDNVIDVFGFNSRIRNDIFEKQVELTTRERGNANVQYGWYGSTDNDIVEALVNGFGHLDRLSETGVLGTGVYLVPHDRAFRSVNLCEVSKEGLQHLLFCRLIMGNAEEAREGTYQSYPSSRNYDLGVDNALNPKRYIVWSTHLQSYIRPEYIVRFELNPQHQAYLNGLKDIRFMEPNKVLYDIPNSLEPFVLIYERFYERLPSWARRLYLHYFEEFKRNKITREDLTLKMSSFIQDLFKDPRITTASNERVANTSARMGNSAEIGISVSLTLAIRKASAQQNEDANSTFAPRMKVSSAEIGIDTTLMLAIGNSIDQQEYASNTSTEMGIDTTLTLAVGNSSDQQNKMGISTELSLATENTSAQGNYPGE